MENNTEKSTCSKALLSHFEIDREKILNVIYLTCETEAAHAQTDGNRFRNRSHGPDGAQRT